MSAQKSVSNEDLGVETVYEYQNVSGGVYRRPGKLGEVPDGAYFSVVGGTKEHEAIKKDSKFELYRTRSSAVSTRKEQQVSGFQRTSPGTTTTA